MDRVAGGRRRKFGAVRQVGGRIDPEHRRGQSTRVVISHIRCEMCDSARLRVGPKKAECEACRQRAERRKTRRAGLRQSLARVTTFDLIRRRSAAVEQMLRRAEQWELLGTHPLPHGLESLERLRAALDHVAVIDARLRVVFETGTALSGRPQPRTDEAVAFRRRLFTDLAKARRDIAVLPTGPVAEDGEPIPEVGLVLSTHAFALARAQFGHRQAVAAFDQCGIRLAVAWKDIGVSPARLGAALAGRTGCDEGAAARVAAIDKAMTRQASEKDSLRRRALGI